MASRVLYDVCNVIESYLCPYFGHLTVKVRECPNLNQRPFYLSRSGISGEATIATMGSLEYLLPCADPSRLYDLMQTARATGQSQGMILGGGLGPFQCYKRPCEVATEITYSAGGLQSNRSLVGYVDKEGKLPESERATSAYISSMGQFFITEAIPGKVIEIIAQSRHNCPSIFDLIQSSLYNKYCNRDLPLGLGGVFYMQNSSAKVSLLNEIPKEPYHTYPCARTYKTPFTIDGPIVGAGTVISHDPAKMGYLMSNFYCWNSRRTLMGQFEQDCDPMNAFYRIYLSPAAKIYREDKPIYC